MSGKEKPLPRSRAWVSGRLSTDAKAWAPSAVAARAREWSVTYPSGSHLGCAIVLWLVRTVRLALSEPPAGDAPS